MQIQGIVLGWFRLASSSLLQNDLFKEQLFSALQHEVSHYKPLTSPSPEGLHGEPSL